MKVDVFDSGGALIHLTHGVVVIFDQHGDHIRREAEVTT